MSNIIRFVPHLYKGSTSYDSFVIGVCDNGTRSVNGMGLKWINENYEDLTKLPSNLFDNHPSWQFDEVIDEFGNYFRKIPIAYWKRGTVPSGPNAGKWYMMLSPEPKDGFTANPAFMYKGEQKDNFLWGTYRAFNNGGKPGSQSDKTKWTKVAYNTFVTAANSIGDGYHMGSFQEYHEILARAVIEKKTFNLYPFSVRQIYVSNEYRGIQEMTYYTSSIYCEMRSGIKFTSNHNFSMWDLNGNQTYVNVSRLSGFIYSGYIGSLRTGSYFDHIFFKNGNASTVSTSMIPDRFLYQQTDSIGVSNFDDNLEYGGAFSIEFFAPVSSPSDSYVTSRLAKI